MKSLSASAWSFCGSTDYILPQIFLRCLLRDAFSGKERSRHLPNVPTTAEMGYPDLQFMGWVGLMGSAKLPADVLARIHAVVQKAARAPAVQQKLSDLGMEPEVNVDTPALQRETRETWERNAGIVKKYDIKN